MAIFDDDQRRDHPQPPSALRVATGRADFFVAPPPRYEASSTSSLRELDAVALATNLIVFLGRNSSLNSELQGLVELQELDIKIGQIQRRVEEVPGQIEGASLSLEDSTENLEQIQEQINQAAKDRRELEGAVELLREQLSKYKDQLMDVKTNREYQAMLHEISNTEGAISANEDEILEHMMRMDELEQRAEQAQKQLKERTAQVSARRQALESFVSESESQVADFQNQRNLVEKQIPKSLLEQYRRIASARDGVALVAVTDQSCQACNVRLRPQLFTEVKASHNIVTCESCNRILYYAGS